VVLWDVDPVLCSAFDAVASDWGMRVARVSGDLSWPTWSRGVRLGVVGRCSARSLCERLQAARKLLPQALVVGLLPGSDLAAASDVVDLEGIAVVDVDRPPLPLASELLEAATVPPACWPRGLVGVSSAVALLRTRIAAAATCDATVLLTGETGTGKSAAARAIHELSARSRAAFVHVDCAALSPTLLESELFGHERGSFTGAFAQRRGRFETAGEGTIFLDEIGEIPSSLQSKFLRVLEEREFERVGSCATEAMRARVIAATQVDLVKAVAEERFRRDLFYRLRVYSIRIPSLRERVADIPALLAHALPRLCGRLRRGVPALAPSFLPRLLEHSWPGNVRELLNVLEALLIPVGDRPLNAAALAGALATPPADLGPWDPEEADTAHDRLREALIATNGNVARVARLLGVPRSTVRYRIERLGLTRSTSPT